MKKLLYLFTIALTMVAATSCDKDNDPINEDPTPIITYDQLQGSWDMVSVNIEGTVYLADDDFPDKNKVIRLVEFFIHQDYGHGFRLHRFPEDTDTAVDYYYVINPQTNILEGDGIDFGRIYFYQISINPTKTQMVLRSDFSFMYGNKPTVGTYTFQKRQ